MFKYLIPLGLLVACSPSNTNSPSNHQAITQDSALKIESKTDTLVKSEQKPAAINDSLNTMAQLIAGTWNEGKIYNNIGTGTIYQSYATNFSKRWLSYDSTRVSTLTEFRNKELLERFKEEKTLFYPFSGPDILHPAIFFPSAKKYIMVGLEPVGTYPAFAKQVPDSFANYFSKLNNSLYAILRFSFFRTESMQHDLKSGELDGAMHLLFLFLNRTGNSIVSAKALSLDTLGNKNYYTSFEELAAAKLRTKGIEIEYNDANGKLKSLEYYSLNASDYEIKQNKGFTKYIQVQGNFNVYLKGASYLLHKSTFSVMRNTILSQADAIVQDDSGVALKYLLHDSNTWTYELFGEYSKPINKFANQFQPLLDSLYKKQGAKKLAFGLGYNYRDKNSNFMIITKNKQGA
ncbi:MAG: hypothetical protein IT236_09485 [Bacteroidia bacterium]|nr:hypothetical protein [Bacteroidia bacterium]